MEIVNMKKIMYTNNEGNVCIVVPVPREHIDRWNRVPCTVIETETVIDHGEEKIIEKEVATTRPLTDAELEMHIWDRSVPVEFIESARWIEEIDIPSTREFRNAWVNVTDETRVDICLEKVRDIKLDELRAVRNKELEKLDKDFMLALERDGDLADIKAKKEALRNITEPLKALDVVGKVNDEELIQQIRDLSSAEVLIL